MGRESDNQAREAAEMEAISTAIAQGQGNPFTQANRHGALQDVTQDGQTNFGDTFLGDLLGTNGGQMGLQGGAGMAASLGGARRDQLPPEVEQAMVEQSAAIPAQTAQEGFEEGLPVSPAQPSPEVIGDGVPIDEEGNPIVDGLLAASGGVLGAAAIRQLLQKANQSPTRQNLAQITDARQQLAAAQIGMDGKPLQLTAPSVENGGIDQKQITGPARANPRGAQVIPTETGAIDDIAPVNETVSDPNAKAVGDVVDDATRAIDTSEVMSETLPDGVKEVANQADGSSEARLVQKGGAKGPNGEMIFSDGVNGGVTAKATDGRYINAATEELLQDTLRNIARVVR
jgi:hypothetical protein